MNKNTDSRRVDREPHQRRRSRRHRDVRLRARSRWCSRATAYSADQIVVANDTTGFLAAAHLSHRQHRARPPAGRRGGAVRDGAFLVGDERLVRRSTDTRSASRRPIRCKRSSRASTRRARASTASYDATTTRSILDATYDSEDDVPIGDDTSGFLAAANLSAAQHGSAATFVTTFRSSSKASQFGVVTNGVVHDERRHASR